MHGIHGTTSLAGIGQPVSQMRLVSAAHEFEAQMMKELLKPMTSKDGLSGDEDEDAISGSTGALGEFASEALGRALSEHGGLGIANSIVKGLSDRRAAPGLPLNHSQSAKVTGKSQVRTVQRKAE
jgi:Rod binding domain-containing protein